MSAAYDPTTWSGYLSAMAGASAALTGLIFVAVSINLRDIVISKGLVARAAKAICTLVGVLAVSTFGLVPGQSRHWLGGEIAGSGLIVWAIVTWTQHLAVSRNPYVTRKTRVLHTFLTQIAALQFVAAGVTLWAGHGGGLYWLVVGSLSSLIVALLDGWVLLIEIQR